MFCALESRCLRNLPGLCSCHFHIVLPSSASSVFQFEAARAFDCKPFYFQDSMKGSALCFSWRTGGRGPRLCACVFLQHSEPKPSKLMGQICKFTPANSIFPGFLCVSSLLMPQRAACTCFISPARQAAQIN